MMYLGLYNRSVALKATNPNLKVLLAVGGWTDSGTGDKYSRMVSSSNSRYHFAKHATDFLNMWGFDGLHLDWQYPTCWQADCSRGPTTDKLNYRLLIQVATFFFINNHRSYFSR